MDENDNRKWIIGTISDGAKSEYWKILKKVVLEWIADENRILDQFKKQGIRKDDISKYNRAVDRIEYLKRFLTINETIVSYHKSILERAKDSIDDWMHIIGESFVKEMYKK